MLYAIIQGVDTARPVRWAIFDTEHAAQILSYFYHGCNDLSVFTVVSSQGQRWTLAQFKEFIQWDGVRV